MNIFSLAENAVTGQVLNPTCAARTGLEYVNFAFLTKNGRPTAPANPVDSTTATFTPDRKNDLFMGSGDNLKVSLHDTPNGLQAVITDQSGGETGARTARAANASGQPPFDPTRTSCHNIPPDY